MSSTLKIVKQASCASERESFLPRRDKTPQTEVSFPPRVLFPRGNQYLRAVASDPLLPLDNNRLLVIYTN